MADYYQILGVSRTATTIEITTAYRNLAKIHHPDKPGGDVDRFKEISQAYHILSNERQRQMYDLQGESGILLNERRTRNGRNDRNDRSEQNEIQSQTFPIPPNNSAFNHIFEHFFGATTDPTYAILDLSLEESYTGCQKKLVYARKIVCQTCLGKKTRDKCQSCAGLKIINTMNSVDVMIQPGMPNDHQITLSQLGDEEINKSPGDLLIQLKVYNHTPFRVNGSDLHLEQSVSLVEALNGVDQTVPFLDGSQIRLTTLPGQMVGGHQPVMYKGSGMPIYDPSHLTYGNLYVTYRIELPNALPDDVKSQIIQLIQLYYH
jgi:DnaJ-class molecular chaperone|uniref:J domain-containing protein n=1 Tax=viral metagenome TaxID=1070528 RepID=A0A6C0BLU4_9ZZZZ